MAEAGTVDTSIYNMAADNNPFEMVGHIVDFRNKLLTNQLNEQAVQANNIKLATERFGMVNNAAAGLLQDPDLGKKDVTSKLWDTLGRLTKGDVMSAQHAVQFMQQFPDANAPGGLAQQAQAIKAVHAQTLDAWQRGQAYLGQTQGISTGGGTKFVGAPAFGGTPQDRGFIPNTLQPSTTQTNPDLSQSYVGGTGNPPIQPPMAPQGTTGQPQRAPTPLPRPSPQPAPATPAALPQAAPIMAAPAPGLAAAKEKAGSGSGEELVDARHRSLNYQQEVFPLEQAIPALEKLGTKGTGPGTESINHLKSFVLSNIPGADFRGLKDDVATYDKAKKYLTDFVNQNGNSGTNDKLAASFAGNPSVNISNAAAVDVAKSALALRRMKQAQLVAFEHSGLPESDYAKFASKWNAHADPRAYGFDLMTPAQRKATLESLPKGKRELFMLNVQDAAENGMIRTPK